MRKGWKWVWGVPSYDELGKYIRWRVGRDRRTYMRDLEWSIALGYDRELRTIELQRAKEALATHETIKAYLEKPKKYTA
jgi:hypothetical protein